MSSPDPFGNNPFGGLFGDLARIMGQQNTGPLNWDVARQVALMIAGQGANEPNVEPVDRMAIEELARVAELHVDQALDIPVKVTRVETVNHIEWANRTLEDYRPLLTALAESLGRTPPGSELDPANAADPFAGLQKMMGPMIFGMQGGGMIGHLARRTIGRFDLPLPRRDNETLVVIPANIDAFADEWSLPRDVVRLDALVEELVRMSIMARPHVRNRLSELVTEYVNGFEPNENALEESLSGLDLQDPTSISNAFDDPQVLLGSIQTPAQERTRAHLQALVSVLVGYTDYIVNDIASRTTSSASAIDEAWRRRRVEESNGARFVERLFGMELTQAQYERGEAFVKGVKERDENGLARLWHSEHELPTPAEVDAPGLWLARIDIPAGDL